MSNQKRNGSNAARGYYIALILCAVAIGISGYLYYRNNHTPEPAADCPASPTEAAEKTDLPVVATEPQTGTRVTVPAEPRKTLQTAAPVDGDTLAEYAMDCLSYNETTRDWRTHSGVDLGGEEETQVLASADGTVYTVYEDDAMGMTVVIRHADDYTTKYASLSEDILVAPGDTVKLGQPIGYVGTTALMESAMGPHVHFSVTCGGELIDPAEFLNLG